MVAARTRGMRFHRRTAGACPPQVSCCAASYAHAQRAGRDHCAHVGAGPIASAHGTSTGPTRARPPRPPSPPACIAREAVCEAVNGTSSLHQPAAPAKGQHVSTCSTSVGPAPTATRCAPHSGLRAQTWMGRSARRGTGCRRRPASHPGWGRRKRQHREA